MYVLFSLTVAAQAYTDDFLADLSERTWFNFLLGEALRRRMLVVGEEAAKEKGLDVEETRTMTELYLRERCTYSVAEIMPR